MNFRNTMTLFSLALALPVTLQAAKADTLNVSQPTTETAVAAQVHEAKDRLETARVRLDIAKKQVDAAKARLKAAEAEFKAARANHEARNLQHEAFKLSESSGLPAITDQLIEENRNRSVASKFPFVGVKQEKLNEQAQKQEVVEPQAQAEPVDLSETRIQQVDFNAQPLNQSESTSEPQSLKPNFRAGQQVGDATTVAPGLVATGPLSTVSAEPPIVP